MELLVKEAGVVPMAGIDADTCCTAFIGIFGLSKWDGFGCRVAGEEFNDSTDAAGDTPSEMYDRGRRGGERRDGCTSGSHSNSDAESPSSYSPSSRSYPEAIISGGGRVCSGTWMFIRSRGPVSLADVGVSNGSSIVETPVRVLK